MTRREKKTPISGSALLGAELRRLRGIRTLDEIAALSAAPPLAGSVPPVSTSTISDVETGKQMPKLLTLYTFSMVYRVSMNQLLGYVVEEGLAKAAADLESASAEDPATAFGRLLSIGEWHRALPLALVCERAATTEREKVRWRGNRALCLARVGLHVEAISMLTACLESYEVSRRQEFMILQQMADIQASAGNFKMATSSVKEALDRVPDDATPLEIGNLEAIRSELTIAIQECSAFVDEPVVREALRLNERAGKTLAGDPAAQLRFRSRSARAYRLLGNRLLADKELEQVLAESVDRRYPLMEARAAIDLARLRLDAGHHSQAQALLERARSVAEVGQQLDLVFEACLQLFQLLRIERPGVAVTHFRRCREILPLLPANAPHVRAFERLAREISG